MNNPSCTEDECDFHIERLIELSEDGLTDETEEAFINSHCKQVFCDFLKDGVQTAKIDLNNPKKDLTNISMKQKKTYYHPTIKEIGKIKDITKGKSEPGGDLWLFRTS